MTTTIEFSMSDIFMLFAYLLISLYIVWYQGNIIKKIKNEFKYKDECLQKLINAISFGKNSSDTSLKETCILNALICLNSTNFSDSVKSQFIAYVARIRKHTSKEIQNEESSSKGEQDVLNCH